MRDKINDVPIAVFLETIENMKIGSNPDWPSPPSFEYLLSVQPVFIRGPIIEIMAQPGYPDNIDWDIVTEDGGMSLLT
tara:strand:+ start:186 stop:419 length:234 start_codon:yes stop_codon:yes gene_type:complete